MSETTKQPEANSIPAVIVMTAVSAISAAFILKTLWGWFLVPLGVPAIGTAHASGIGSLVMMFKHKKSSGGMPTVSDHCDVIGWYLAIFGIAWIEHWIMVRP